MPTSNQATCWVVTDGKSGMENQCLGLAEALGLAPVVKRVKLRSPWRQFSPFLTLGLGLAHNSDSDFIGPPWPDLIIATGRASVPAALYARRDSLEKGGRTITVQLQNPVISPSNFDLVVVPQHDDLRGPNVLVTRGALHRVTFDYMKEEAKNFFRRFQRFLHQRIAVLIGGTNAVYNLTPKEMAPIAVQLAQLAKSTGGSLLVTPSRRTGAENMAVLRNALRDVPSYIWDGQGWNPYYGMLGIADYVIVTCDSVNMVSEACTTGKPVYVIDLPGGSDKFRKFHEVIRNDDLARPFEGRLENWRYQPLKDMELVADRVRELLAKRA